MCVCKPAKKRGKKKKEQNEKKRSRKKKTIMIIAIQNGSHFFRLARLPIIAGALLTHLFCF